MVKFARSYKTPLQHVKNETDIYEARLELDLCTLQNKKKSKNVLNISLASFNSTDRFSHAS